MVSPGATFAMGYKQSSRSSSSDSPTPLLGNATSHADAHGHGCPSAPAMQQCGGADLTATLHR
jgi:hypothetical protein